MLLKSGPKLTYLMTFIISVVSELCVQYPQRYEQLNYHHKAMYSETCGLFVQYSYFDCVLNIKKTNKGLRL